MPPRSSRSPIDNAMLAENLQRLVQALAVPGAVDDPLASTGRTPLLAASQRGWVEGVLTLLDHGAQPDHNPQGVDNGQTALMHLLRQGFAPVEPAIDALLAHGARPDAVDCSGETPLAVAAFCDNLPGVHRMLRAAPRWLNDLPDGAHWRPLECAAFEGHARMCQALLELGANPDLLHRHGPNPGAYDGWAPLHLATSQNHLDAMRTLLAGGANPDALNLQLKTPMEVAVRARRQAAMVLLEQHALNRAAAGVADPTGAHRPDPHPCVPSRTRTRL